MEDRYIAFDVETPNSANDRMSAIGVAIVEDGEIVDEFYSLVNPETHFDRFNISLTGITPEMVADQPTFPELWDNMAPMMEGGLLVAHNAPFDMSVLAKCLRYYGISWYPRVKYACTCQMSRRAFPELPNHKLNTLCEYLHLGLDHHHAGSDSRACGEILLRCLKNGTDIRPFIRTYVIDYSSQRSQRSRPRSGIAAAPGAAVERPSSRSKYAPLGTYLLQSGRQELVLSFPEIEKILGFSLPPSARKYAAWWANNLTNSQAKGWMGTGYQVKRTDILQETATFRKKQQMNSGETTMLDWNHNGKLDPVDVGISIAARSAVPDEADDECEDEAPVFPADAEKKRNLFSRFAKLFRKPSPSVQPVKAPAKSGAPMKVALISCTKEKMPCRCMARELYSPSTLFSLSYQYARQHADKIYILSAKYGLLAEDAIVEPYDLTLKTMSREERIQWTYRVYDQLKANCSVNEDTFMILAGRSYYEFLLPMLPNATLPLGSLPMGKRIAYLNDLVYGSDRNSRQIGPSPAPGHAVPAEKATQAERGVQLHQLFCALPRYHWQDIDDIPFQDGIYLVFERSETYHGLPRIVRVGTHTSPNRLKQRLYDHFVRENHNGSIFRKNIGKAMLNRENDPYLSTWTLDTSKPPYVGMQNRAKEAEVERAVTSYLRENMTFAVFPVNDREQRLRLEEAIISSLHHTSDFKASDAWLGSDSPESVIRQSGMWLKQGLDAMPLTDAEMHALAGIAASVSAQPRSAFVASHAPADGPSSTLRVGDRINHRIFGDGVVVDLNPMGADTLMTVDFAGVGTKKLFFRTASNWITRLS
ncbi:MAG: hypothetical protein E7474_05190 [Ruminococcaceae bacterium]|nr:hypothetical protein [Oscillospiraceae bacterium]